MEELPTTVQELGVDNAGPDLAEVLTELVESGTGVALSVAKLAEIFPESDLDSSLVDGGEGDEGGADAAAERRGENSFDAI